MGEKGATGRFITVLQLGFTFVLNVMAFAAIGRWIDARAGASGAVTAIFILTGVASSFVISYVALSRLTGRGR